MDSRPAPRKKSGGGWAAATSVYRPAPSARARAVARYTPSEKFQYDSPRQTCSSATTRTAPAR